MDSGRGPIPERWLYCPRKSDSLIADKFLAFKTPLSEEFGSQMPEECLFTPKMLVAIMKAYKVKIGLWIDLTNTNRFYNRQDVEANDIKYIKLKCRGHGETPSPEQTQSFIGIVDEFMHDNPLDAIGVHCTHGFNRTGFLIVAYMVERMDCSVEAALLAFAQARPPGIYKEDYIRELFRRYEDESEQFPVPSLPDWCFDDGDYGNGDEEYEDDSPVSSQKSQKNGEASSNKHELKRPRPGDGDESETNSPKKKRKKEFLNLNATFMTGVPGVELFIEQPRLTELHRQVHQMCDWRENGFPGCQPISMDRNNIKLLQIKPYMVSWKADGTRYMMLIAKENEVYFFDRDYSCFKVSKMRFPSRKNLSKHVENTLLDGVSNALYKL